MLAQAHEEDTSAVAVDDFFADVERSSFHGIALVIFHDALHDELGDGECLRMPGDHSAHSIQPRAHAEGITKMSGGIHVRRNRELHRADNSYACIESQRLLERMIGPERQVHVLVVGLKHHSIAGEVPSEGYGGLSVGTRDELQQAESRGEILPYGSG